MKDGGNVFGGSSSVFKKEKRSWYQAGLVNPWREQGGTLRARSSRASYSLASDKGRGGCGCGRGGAGGKWEDCPGELPTVVHEFRVQVADVLYLVIREYEGMYSNVRQRRIGGCKCGSSTCSSPVFCTVLSSNEFFGSDGERRKKNEMIEKGPSSADQGVRSWTNDQDTKIGGKGDTYTV